MLTAKRPLSITIISGLLIAWGGLVLIPLLLYLFGLFPDYFNSIVYFRPFEIAIGIVTPVFSILSGTAMLNRFSWGRRIFVVTTIITVFPWFIWSTGYFQLFSYVIRVIACGIILFFLFKQSASDYFKVTSVTVPQSIPNILIPTPTNNETLQPNQKPVSTGRRVLAVIIFVFSIMFTGGMVVALILGFHEKGTHLIVHLIFLFMILLGSGMTLGGLAIWDWTRRRIVSGVILCILGAYLLFADASLIIMSFLPESLITGYRSLVFKHSILSLTLVSIVLIALGILAIIRQYKLDKASFIPERQQKI